MSTTRTTTTSTTSSATPMRKNGKNWHDRRTPFRPLSSTDSVSTSSISKVQLKAKAKKAFQERVARDGAVKAVKEHEAALKEEKEAERQRRVSAIKEKREKKAERERFEALQAKMGRKRAERKRRREHRNKLLNS